ncbi:MAG: type II toxin-antitoxin system HicA family toxin [Paludibacteraceae bacterium]
MRKITNIPLSDYRKFLQAVGCVCVSTNGGHEKWKKDGLTRPIIVQTHIDPVPAFILKNALRNLGISTEEFLSIVDSL